MILKISEKINVNGWCRQLTIDFDNKTYKAEAFQFHTADISKVTHMQYMQFIEFCINNNFKAI